MVLLALSLACAPEPGRVLEVVDDTAAGVPDPDNGEGTAGMGFASGMSCVLDAEAAPVDALALDWCVRVTPEGPFDGPDEDSAPSDTATIPVEDPAAPPCGFVNLVGAVALAGAAASPELLYCDADPDGGLRVARYDPEADGVWSRVVAPGECLADPRSGSLRPAEGGYLAAWTAIEEDWDDVTGVHLARLAPSGEALTAIRTVETGSQAMRSDLGEAGGAVLLTVDLDGVLRGVTLDADGGPAGDAVELADGVHEVAQATGAAGTHVVWCDADGALALGFLDGAGLAPVGTLGTCGNDARPSVAWDGVAVWVAWDDGDAGHVVRLDESGAVLAAVELGPDALRPQLAWNGAHVYLADTTGALARWDADGVEAGRWSVRPVALAPGVPIDLRLRVDTTHVAVALVGMDYYEIGGGHINTYNYVEVSVSEVP